jgi:uncharacterized protein with FMN-binding domain
VRRAAAAVIGTIAGTSLLIVTKLGVHPPDAGLTGSDTSAVAGAGGPSPLPAGGDDQQDDGSPASASTGPVPAQPSAGPSRPAGAPTTTAAAPRPTPLPTTAGTGLRNGSFTGTGVKERYGTITVTITVSGGRVTDAGATCGGCNSESQSISTNAFSRLRQEALQAQSATIATVSGATYTSGAYKTSLQAALNAAHA